ncbi:hypothetical protein T265_10636 [Opisthorchis viverrini]|uniref:Uncharacterized protein n=1 Tax=Opisthorchis viverrini TaxID=6198 RepID=A0A074Z1P8_OPIVI|nr:hypothetical protein T265_10636 [Opisthorchis viverrini]KER20908.1 hypothetical protein T265_10636 [Opisthorchis viverrini]
MQGGICLDQEGERKTGNRKLTGEIVEGDGPKRCNQGILKGVNILRTNHCTIDGNIMPDSTLAYLLPDSEFGAKIVG